MNKEQIFNYCLENLKKSEIKIDEPMSKHTSFKIGGNADIFIKIANIDELKLVTNFAKNNNIKVTIIGNGSNVLVKDKGIRGIVIKLDLKNIDIEKLENRTAIVTAGAGVPLGMLAQKLLSESIAGLEFASGIPGTIGGAIRMNAGAYGGEFKNIVISTKCLNEKGDIIILNNEQQKFSYRHSIFEKNKMIILETKLLLNIVDDIKEIKKIMDENLVSRKTKQPINIPNAGSTFKRGEDFITAKLIDECGLRGYSIGGAQVSQIHAGFIVNKGNATAEDVLNLVEYIKKEVYKKFQRNLQLEIEVLGE